MLTLQLRLRALDPSGRSPRSAWTGLPHPATIKVTSWWASSMTCRDPVPSLASLPYPLPTRPTTQTPSQIIRVTREVTAGTHGQFALTPCVRPDSANPTRWETKPDLQIQLHIVFDRQRRYLHSQQSLARLTGLRSPHPRSRVPSGPEAATAAGGLGNGVSYNLS